MRKPVALKRDSKVDSKPVAVPRKTEPPKKDRLIKVSTAEEARDKVAAMTEGTRVTVVAKSDRCGWCQKYMDVLDEMKSKDDKTLGEIMLIEVNDDAKAKEKTGEVIHTGMAKFRGMPHSIIIDREKDHFFVASFAGFVPKEKLGEAIATAQKEKIEVKA